MAVLMKNLVARAPKMEDAVAINEQAKRLFEREGYTPIRRFWRIAVGPNDSHEKSARPGDFKADLDVDSLNLVGASQLVTTQRWVKKGATRRSQKPGKV